MERSRFVHGTKYSYAKTEYLRSNLPVIITCSEHGDFKQLPSLHLSGRGCQQCAFRDRALKNTKTTAEFVRDAIDVHGLRYSYEKTIYHSAKEPVIIGCSLHGDFSQVANDHLSGYGCQKCGDLRKGIDSISSFLADEQRAQEYCELSLVTVDQFLKIGISVDTLERDKAFYDEYLLILPGTRSQCWVAEQYLLDQTSWLEPSNLPSKFLKWRGRRELRLPDVDIDELKNEIERVHTQVLELGWFRFAKSKELFGPAYGWREY